MQKKSKALNFEKESTLVECLIDFENGFILILKTSLIYSQEFFLNVDFMLLDDLINQVIKIK